MSATHTPGIDLDRMAADAQTRPAAFINRTAAQQTRRMRESWGEVVGTAPEVGTNQHTSLPPITHRPPSAYKAAPYPWDDITPTKGDDYSDDEMSIAEFAIGLICFAALVFVTGFGAGYFSAVH